MKVCGEAQITEVLLGLADPGNNQIIQRSVLKKNMPRQVVWVTGLGTLVALKRL